MSSKNDLPIKLDGNWGAIRIPEPESASSLGHDENDDFPRRRFLRGSTGAAAGDFLEHVPQKEPEAVEVFLPQEHSMKCSDSGIAYSINRFCPSNSLRRFLRLSVLTIQDVSCGDCYHCRTRFGGSV